jgi:hypothetical protein
MADADLLDGEWVEVGGRLDDSVTLSALLSLWQRRWLRLLRRKVGVLDQQLQQQQLEQQLQRQLTIFMLMKKSRK